MGEKKPVAKLGIYVPEHRLKDVEKWRDKMIFSDVFWKAFDNEIALLAKSAVKGPDMRKLIERLKTEAGKEMEDGKLNGAEAGRDWALDYATRADLQLVAEVGVPAKYGDVLGFVMQEYEKVFPAHWWEELTDHISDHAAFRLGFCRGFDAAVYDIWKQVKSSL